MGRVYKGRTRRPIVCRDCEQVQPYKARGLCHSCYCKRYRTGDWDGPVPKPAPVYVWRRITGEVTTTCTIRLYVGDPT